MRTDPRGQVWGGQDETPQGRVVSLAYPRRSTWPGQPPSALGVGHGWLPLSLRREPFPVLWLKRDSPAAAMSLDAAVMCDQEQAARSCKRILCSTPRREMKAGTTSRWSLPNSAGQIFRQLPPEQRAHLGLGPPKSLVTGMRCVPELTDNENGSSATSSP